MWMSWTSIRGLSCYSLSVGIFVFLLQKPSDYYRHTTSTDRVCRAFSLISLYAMLLSFYVMLVARLFFCSRRNLLYRIGDRSQHVLNSRTRSNFLQPIASRFLLEVLYFCPEVLATLWTMTRPSGRSPNWSRLLEDFSQRKLFVRRCVLHLIHSCKVWEWAKGSLTSWDGFILSTLKLLMVDQDTIDTWFVMSVMLSSA